MKLLVAVAVALLVSQASAATEGQRTSSTGGRTVFSKYSVKMGSYLPVHADHAYAFYRIAIMAEQETYATYDPTPESSTLAVHVSTFRLMEPVSMVTVGRADSESVVITGGSQPGAPSSLLNTLFFELGPEGEDEIMMSGAFEGNRGAWQIRDHDKAIVGGTGRFRGATGDTTFENGESAGKFTMVLNVWVPRLREY